MTSVRSDEALPAAALPCPGTAEALRDSEQRFRLAFDRAAIGMLMTDIRPDNHGLIIRANQTFADMLGYTPEELAARPVVSLTHPDDVPRDISTMRRLQNGEIGSASYEKRYLRRDGRPVWTLLTTAVASDRNGVPQYVVSQVIDVTDRKQAQAALERLALTDPLTGLPNRTLFADRASQALRRLQRGGGHVALLLVNIDRFKLVNEMLGHCAGDALLIAAGRRLTGELRVDSTVARLGGDEFAVLLDRLQCPDDAQPVAARILEALRSPYTLPGADEPINTTASIAVAVTDRADRSLDDLRREADLALDRAKESGGGRVAVFDDELHHRAVSRVNAERRLRAAIQEGRLRLRYQPIVALDTGLVAGAEALVRVEDPEQGLLGPADFIDVAEETGLVTDIDAWVLERTAAQMTRWPWLAEEGMDGLAVNVSARSLERPDFVGRLEAALDDHAVPGERLHIELTERVLLEVTGHTKTNLARLAELRTPIGIDDFGTGYSALSYLQRFALDFIKIDRSFTSQLGVSGSGTAIVGAIIDLAHALDLTVIAEGVESSEQLQLLRRLGCDRAQGYLFSRPTTPDEIDAMVRSRRRW